jgi:hypothetical protein
VRPPYRWAFGTSSEDVRSPGQRSCWSGVLAYANRNYFSEAISDEIKASTVAVVSLNQASEAIHARAHHHRYFLR